MNTERNSIKKELGKTFNDPGSKYFILVNDFFSIVTIVSIVSLILETVDSLRDYFIYLQIIEYIAVALFTVEYVVRLYVSREKSKYIFSFFGLVDLLAILPTYLGLTNLTFLKSVRILRILRFLRMLRLAKIMRISKKENDIEDYSYLYKINIQIYFFSLFSSIIILGSLMYVAEGANHNFSNIPEGMMWAAETILGGSISGKVATSLAGNIISLLTRFIGLVLLGLLVHVIGNVIKKIIFGSEKIIS